MKISDGNSCKKAAMDLQREGKRLRNEIQNVIDSDTFQELVFNQFV